MSRSVRQDTGTMGTLRRLASARGLTHARSRGGQIATFMILAMMAVIVMIMMTANLGQASLNATTVANAADAAALNLGSQLATKSHVLQQSLYRSKGGSYSESPTPRRCVRKAFWSIILPIVMALASVFFPGFMPFNGMWAAAGNGAIGGLIGGAVDFGSLEGAAVGALTGFQIGAAIGAGASSFGAGTATTNVAAPFTGAAPPAGWATVPVTTSTFSIGAAQLGAAVAAGATTYNAIISDKLETRAMEAAARALSGLPDRVRIQQAVIMDALSRAVDDPTMVPDNGTAKFEIDGQKDPLGVPPDVDVDGLTTDEVPRFLAWWEARLEAISKEISKKYGKEYYAKVRDEIQKYFTNDLKPFVQRMKTHLATNPGKNEDDNNWPAYRVYGRSDLRGVLAWSYDEWNPKQLKANPPPKNPGVTWTANDGPLMLLLRSAESQVLQWPKNQPECDLGKPPQQACQKPPSVDQLEGCIYRFGRSTGAKDQSTRSGNRECYNLKFWEPGPTEPEIDAWENCELDCLKDCEAKCMATPGATRLGCSEKCNSDAEATVCAEKCNITSPWTEQWDELDGLRDEIEEDLIEWARFVLNPDRRKQILSTWDEWVYLFRDHPNDVELVDDANDEGVGVGKYKEEFKDRIPTLIETIKEWRKELEQLSQKTFPLCQDKDGTPLPYSNGAVAWNYPCSFTSGGQVRITMDSTMNLTTIAKKLDRDGVKVLGQNVLMDDIELVDYQLNRLEGDLDKFYVATGEFMKFMDEYRVAPAEAKADYKWTDTQGEHTVTVQVGPFLIPKIKPKTTTTLGDRTKCMVLRYGQDMAGARTWVRVTRTDPGKMLGLWQWIGGRTEKRSKVWYRWDGVGVYNTD